MLSVRNVFFQQQRGCCLAGERQPGWGGSCSTKPPFGARWSHSVSTQRSLLWPRCLGLHLWCISPRSLEVLLVQPQGAACAGHSSLVRFAPRVGLGAGCPLGRVALGWVWRAVVLGAAPLLSFPFHLSKASVFINNKALAGSFCRDHHQVLGCVQIEHSGFVLLPTASASTNLHPGATWHETPHPPEPVGKARLGSAMGFPMSVLISITERCLSLSVHGTGKGTELGADP